MEFVCIFINILLIRAGFCHKNQGFRAFTRKIAERPKALLNFYKSEDNTDKSVASLIDNALQGRGQLCSRFLGHMLKLGMKPLVDQFIQGFTKHIRLPYAFGILLKFLELCILGSIDRLDLDLDLKFLKDYPEFRHAPVTGMPYDAVSHLRNRYLYSRNRNIYHFQPLGRNCRTG